MKNSFFSGLFFIIIGGILLLNTLGIVPFSLWSNITIIWPFLLIIAGILYFMKQKMFGGMLLTLSILLMCIGFIQNITINFDEVETREFVQEIKFDEEHNEIELDIEYGLGKLNIQKGDENQNTVKTNSANDPILKTRVEGKIGIIDLSENDQHPGIHEMWTVDLTEKLKEIDIDSGVGEMNIDLVGLEAKLIDIDHGIGETNIIFENYPSETKISQGIGQLTLTLPNDIGVKINCDCGIVEKKFNGFKIVDDYYVNDHYDSGKENLEIEIEMGIGEVKVIS